MTLAERVDFQFRVRADEMAPRALLALDDDDAIARWAVFMQDIEDYLTVAGSPPFHPDGGDFWTFDGTTLRNRTHDELDGLTDVYIWPGWNATYVQVHEDTGTPINDVLTLGSSGTIDLTTPQGLMGDGGLVDIETATLIMDATIDAALTVGEDFTVDAGTDLNFFTHGGYGVHFVDDGDIGSSVFEVALEGGGNLYLMTEAENGFGGGDIFIGPRRLDISDIPDPTDNYSMLWFAAEGAGTSDVYLRAQDLLDISSYSGGLTAHDLGWFIVEDTGSFEVTVSSQATFNAGRFEVDSGNDFTVVANGEIALQSNSDAYMQDGSTSYFYLPNDGTAQIGTSTGLLVFGLPTSDPVVSGALWVDGSGVVHQSP